MIEPPSGARRWVTAVLMGIIVDICFPNIISEWGRIQPQEPALLVAAPLQ
jgi:hypothetical protein